MSNDLHHFALWSLAILTAAVAVILYQHSTHTGAIIGLMGAKGSLQPDPAVTSANPDVYGTQSRASGVWTPIGPISAVTGKIASPLPYLPSIGQ